MTSLICTNLNLICIYIHIYMHGHAPPWSTFNVLFFDPPSILDTRIQDSRCPHVQWITLWLFNKAMENGTFINGLPIKNGDFPWLWWITRWYIDMNLVFIRKIGTIQTVYQFYLFTCLSCSVILCVLHGMGEHLLSSMIQGGFVWK